MNKIQGWSDVTLGLMETIEDINQSHISDDDKTFRLAALFNGIEFDEFLSLPLDEAKTMVGEMGWLADSPKKAKVKKEYVLNGKKYVLMADVANMTVAQYIDFQSLTRNPQMQLSELMGIVLIPKGHQYNEGYDHNDAIDDIMSMKVEEALAVADFFTSKSERLTRRLLRRAETAMAVLKITNRKDKELMEAIALQMNLIIGELRSECGYHWWKQWPK